MTISPANTPFSICVIKTNYLFTFTRQRSPSKNFGVVALSAKSADNFAEKKAAQN
ncbi:hypothetical protein [Anabaena sp. CCY 9402-a]|uniref:hypothetical protein n=1 Tax=Anabaena sp. CCY 9402-a TaxID=3103867 RepID=UPI0039C5BB0F